MELKKNTPVKKLPLPKKMSNGISKEAVLYIYRPDTNITCGQCVFVEGNKCKIFDKNQTISPSMGSCGFFIKGNENKNIPFIGTITKVEAGYIENKNGFTCKRCEEWIPETKSCKKVDKDSKGDTPGIIHPDACCNRWEADPIRGNMTDVQIKEYLKEEK